MCRVSDLSGEHMMFFAFTALAARHHRLLTHHHLHQCLLEIYKGDKICDDGNNNAYCNWDGACSVMRTVRVA